MKEDTGEKSNEPAVYKEKKTAEKSGTSQQFNNDSPTTSTPKKNTKLMIILISVIAVVIIAAIVLVVVLVVTKKKKDEYPYSITALYNFKKDEEGIIFNPSRVGLTDDQYKIEFSSGDEKSRRLLTEITIVDGRFISTEDALIKIVIKMKINLTNLNFLFQGSENLINVDFTNLKMKGIENMMYLFAGCTNLEKVDFTNLDTSKVEYMEFIFGLCTNLQKINGIEYFDTTSLKNAAGMFYSCENLPSLNLSSFNFEHIQAQQGIFAKTDSLQILDIRSLNNTDNMFGSPQTTKNNLQILLNEKFDKTDIEKYSNFKPTTDLNIQIDITTECTPTDDSNCLSCGFNKTFNTFVCNQCKKGYYLPQSDDFGKLKCKKCDEGCENCIAGWNESICFLCKYGYKLYDEYNKYNSDESNNYYSTATQGRCVKDCAGTSCKECYYDENGAFCYQCLDGYVLFGTKCYKNCETLQNEGCENCVTTDNGNRIAPTCKKCKEGYYIPDSSNECSKCSLDGCTECSGKDKLTNTCTKCENIGSTIKENDKIVSCYDTCERGADEKCKSCSSDGKCGSCNDGYTLYKGSCNYCAFIATYETDRDNEEVEFFLKIPIGKMKIDGVEIEKPSNKYKFEKAGKHEVCVKFDKVPMMSNLFAYNRHVVSIVFNPSFDTSKLTFVNGAFQRSPKLESIDFSRIDLRNTHCIHYWFMYDVKLKEVIFPKDYKITPYFLDHTFYGCTSLTSIDLSSFELSGVYDLTSMFEGCTNLKYIDISNFDHPEKKYQVRNMFKGLPEGGKIKKGNDCPSAICGEKPSSWSFE